MPENQRKVIVITGVTRGLGRAMAEEFAKKGHVVLGCGRNKKDIHAITTLLGKPHDFDAVDVSSDTEVAHWAGRLLAQFNAPDLLLNNAALINPNATLWRVPAEVFSQVIDVNIKGVFHVIRHFAPAMIVRRKGVIINFSSECGRSTLPELAPYCATKYAIEGLTQALSQELPTGMTAVALSPGAIHTDMLQSCFGEEAHRYPLPEEWVRKAVPFILRLGSKDNGQSLTCPS